MWPTFIALCLALSPKTSRKAPPRRRPAFRRPLLEPLEDRTMLDATWLTGVGVVGDSISTSYSAPTDTVHDWVAELVGLRGLNFGSTPGVSSGYSFDWSGPNTYGALAAGAPNLAGQISAGQVSLAAVELGAHDFIWYPNPQGPAPYEDAGDTSHWVVGDIFSGALGGTALQSYTNQVITNLGQTFDTLVGGGYSTPLVAFNIPDFSVTPSMAALDAANPAGAQAYTAAIGAADAQYQTMAAQRGMPLVDLYRFGQLVNSSAPVVVGGVTLDMHNYSTPANPYDFFADSQHPGTIASGLIANMFIMAVDEAYGAGIAPLSDQEILQYAGIAPPTSGPTYFDVSLYVLYVPPVSIVNGSTPGASAAGDRDPSFGGVRPVITDLGAGAFISGEQPVFVYPKDTVNGVNGGKILTAGAVSVPNSNANFAMFRYNPDGAPDTSFGGNGIVLTTSPVGVGSWNFEADGKVLVSGTVIDAFGNSDLAVARYLAQDTTIDGVTYHAGDLDPTFGNGGVATTHFGPAGSNNPDADSGYLTTLTVDHQGRIIVAGFISWTFGQSTYLGSRYSFPDGDELVPLNGLQHDSDIVVARYNSDGTPDTTFGSFGVQVESDIGRDFSGLFAVNTGNGANDTFASVTGSAPPAGAVITDFGAGSSLLYDESAFNVVVDSQNRILVSGGSNTGQTGVPYLLVRYSPDGQLDTTFNGTGWVENPNINPGILLVDASDRVLSWYRDSSGNVTLMRTAADGSPDTSFNGTGTETIAHDATSLSPDAVAIDSNRNIVVGFDSNVPGISLIRLTDNGASDGTFGNSGEVDSHFSSFNSGGNAEDISGIAIQSDGNIAVVGFTSRPVTGFDDVVVSRYLAQPVSVPQGTQLTYDSSFYDPNPADMPSLTYAWSVSDTAGYSLPAGTATSNADFTFTPDLPGTYTISLTVGNADPAGATTTVTKTFVVTQLTPQSLQQALPQSAGAANSMTIQASANVTPATVISDVNALINVTQPVTVILDLGGGTYSSGGIAANPPPNVTFEIVNGTLDPSYPALTVAGGQVAVLNCTLTTSGNTPTILVTGGSLALRDDVVVQTSSTSTAAAVSVTGGTVDLGTAATPGGNTLSVGGTGQLVQTTTAGSVSAVGDTFQVSGTTLTAPTLSFTSAASSAATSILNQSVTFTATVQANGTGTPTGSVDFIDATTNTDLGSRALSGGTAALTTTALAVGNHVILARYGGDATFLPSLAVVAQSVQYRFGGYLPPLHANMSYTAGKTIPIKFQLTDYNGASITSLGAVTSLQVLNGSGTDVLAGAGKTGLRYDPTANQFVYNWQTKGLANGTYTVLLALADGTTDSLTLTLSSKGAFQLADGATSGYDSATANQVLFGTLAVAVADDTGAGIDPNEVARISDAMTYLNSALGQFGVSLSWAAAGTAADVTIHFASSTPEGGAADGVLGFTTADNDVYLVEGWDFYTGSDPTQVGAGQYDFQTLAEHELGHTVGLGESSDPASVMYEYLALGTARRAFTDGNLTAINTDADRFMKIGRGAPQGGAGATVQQTIAISGIVASRSALPGGAGGVSAWAPALIEPAPSAVALSGPVGAGLRADMPGEGGHDVLAGGTGDDLLIGGAGQDLLVGGFASGSRGSASLRGMNETTTHAADSYFQLMGDVAAREMTYGPGLWDAISSDVGDIGDAN
jgi:uncharacterized delta-60 repeat protein